MDPYRVRDIHGQPVERDYLDWLYPLIHEVADVVTEQDEVEGRVPSRESVSGQRLRGSDLGRRTD